MKPAEDIELNQAVKEREIQVEHKLNIIRVWVVSFLIVMDMSIAGFSGKLNFRLILMFLGLGFICFLYFLIVHTLTSGNVYRYWVKYMTVTGDYLLTLFAFIEYRQAHFFQNISDELIVSHFIILLILINLLSALRYSKVTIIYSTGVGFLSGIFLLVRYIQFSWVTLFTPPMILISGLLTLWISSDLGKLFLRLRLRERLMRFLSKDIVESIDSGLINLELGGEKKEVTVLFADIRNFTKMSEGKDPYEIVSILNEYLTAMTKIIFEHGGTIDKFIGDAIMTVFGTPVSKADDPLRAVQAASRMQKRLEELNAKWISENRTPIEIGIALHTGTVVAGNIGSPERMEYTVIGDTVNLTSRIEGLNKTYHTNILVCQSTYNHVKKEIPMMFVAETQVRGRNEPTKLYTLKTTD